MRVFRFLVVVCGILLLLTACNRDGSGSGSTSSSSARSVAREGRSSTDAMMEHPSSAEAMMDHGSSSIHGAVSSASSARSQASSRSSAKAPFFSLGSGDAASSVSSARASSARSSSARSAVSSAASSVPVRGLSSSVRETVTAGNIKVHLDADRGEARSGDHIHYVVTVKNLSDRTVRDASVVFSFSPAQVSVLEADGTVLTGKVQWTVDELQPGEKRALRVRAAAAQGLAHGEIIRASAVATVNGVVEPQTGSSNVTIIRHLPATGASDFTGPLENTRRFLTPFRGGGAIPAIVWGATLAMGLALGARASKKFL